jgi:hypothetical protein
MPHAERCADQRDELAAHIVDRDFRRRRLPLALLRISRLKRTGEERHHRAGVARCALLDAEHYMVADIGDNARNLRER